MTEYSRSREHRIPRYCQYHWPIDSPKHVGSNRSITMTDDLTTVRGKAWTTMRPSETLNLLNREAEHAREMAAELEALVPVLSNEKPRQLAQLQVKASHKRAKDFRELAQTVGET
jgi:hypothetical protein